MAKLELYPQDLIFELTAKDKGVVVDLTVFQNYQCTVFSGVGIIQKFSKLERTGFDDVIAIDEENGVFQIKIKRENLIASNPGNIFCVISANTIDEDFTDSKDLDVGNADYLFTLLKSNNIDYANI